MTDKLVCMVQPPPVPAPAPDNQYLASPHFVNAPRHPRRCFLCDQTGHFASSSPAKLELRGFLQQQRTCQGLQAPPQSTPALPPTPFPLPEGIPTPDGNRELSFN